MSERVRKVIDFIYFSCAGVARSILSDTLSHAIVKLNEQLQHTTLWDNVSLRRVILAEALPKMLVKQLGLDLILKRVPDNYIRAIFGSFLASRFVYKYGTEPSQFAFFEFMTPYFQELAESSGPAPGSGN